MEPLAMIRIPIGEPEDLPSTVERKLRRVVGPGVFIERQAKNDERCVYTIGMAYNELLDDSREDRIPTICAREVNSVFCVDVIGEGGKYAISMPSIESIVETMAKKRLVDAFRSERIIVQKGYERFVSINSVALSLSPIAQILDAVSESESITVNDLYHRRGKKKMLQYLDFLSQVDYLRKENGTFVRGPKFDALAAEDSAEKRMKVLLADLVGSEHDYLQTYFHLTTMTPYVRLSNSYYFPSGSSGELIRMLPDLLRRYQKNYYGIAKPVPQIKRQAMTMRWARIFGKENGYIVGEEELFESYCQAMGC